MVETSGHFTLEPVRFGQIPGWMADDHAACLSAYCRSFRQAGLKPYRTGSLGLSSDDLLFSPQVLATGNDDPRGFFEKNFSAFLIRPAHGRGFVTSYYEPIVEASLQRTAAFTVPLYRRPDDLISVDDGNRPPDLDPYLAFARRDAGKLVEYYDRKGIEEGALAGRGLEIAWLADPVVAFFIHVQGAARLRLTSGGELRITYAAKSGQRFTGPGGILVEMGEIAREAISMQAIRAWFRQNPDRIDELLRRNRSFIFFREADVDDPALGPIAAAKVPLTSGRSLAVDRLVHTFGTPFFIDAPDLTRFGGKPFRRLMIAQDTGSAIVGPARGDLFAGTGDEAGEIAGGVRHDADFYILLPKCHIERQS